MDASMGLADQNEWMSGWMSGRAGECETYPDDWMWFLMWYHTSQWYKLET